MAGRHRQHDPLGLVRAAVAVVAESCMIPFVIPAALKALPWRLIGAACLTAAVAFAGSRVSAWHEGYLRAEASERSLATRTTELQQCTYSQTAAALAYAGAVRRAETVAADDAATATRIERELQTNLAAADARSRDLSRRLQDYRARRCRVTLSAAAGAAAEPAPPAAQSGDGDAVDRATADHLAACALDAEELAGWLSWWESVKRPRSPPD